MEADYDSSRVNDIMNSYFSLTLYPETMEALQRFSLCKRAVLTNGNPDMFHSLIIKTGLNKYLEGTLSADSVRLFKPRPEVYQLAVDFFGADKNEILFVSSNAWDIAGAKSFGFKVGWINRFNQPAERLGVRTDYITSDLSELAQAVMG